MEYGAILRKELFLVLRMVSEKALLFDLFLFVSGVATALGYVRRNEENGRNKPTT